MLNKRKLKTALYQYSKTRDWLPKAQRLPHTYFTWVNWRSYLGAQIAVSWYGMGCVFRVYFDFPENHRPQRDKALAALAKQFAPRTFVAGKIQGHGWTKEENTFLAERFIGVREIYQIVKPFGCRSILYVQESRCGREIFTQLGIPLVPGENGKEWIDGKFIPYATPRGKCI